jgi:PRTRC genetic system protein A
MDARDIALQSVTPTVMVPRFTELTNLTEPGQRILMAANGIWLEVRRAWLYVRLPVAKLLNCPVPYGDVQEAMQFRFGKLPRTVVTQFIELARVRSPNECAAWVIWNERTDSWRLQMLEEISVGHGHVEVNLPKLADDEHLVIDLHSHGTFDAFFSPTDDNDDKGECKFAGVIGNLDGEQVTTAFRLCVNGQFISIPYHDSPQGQEEW